WDPSLRRHRKIKTVVHHAHDREALAVHFDVLTYYVGIGRVTLLPESMTQDDFLIFADLFFFRKENAPKSRLDPDGVKEVGGDLEGLPFLRFAVAGQVDLIPGVRGHGIERVSLLLPLEKCRRRDWIQVPVLPVPRSAATLRVRVH